MLISIRLIALSIFLLAGITLQAQDKTETKNSTPTTMKTYLIEREIPDAGMFTAEQLKGISQTSCTVLENLGPEIKWLHSYVTGNHIYCVYQATNEEIIREHGAKGGFPVTNIMEVANTISPATAK